MGHTPVGLTDATADLTWALLMAARQVVAGDRFTRSGQWQTWEPALLLGPDVAGQLWTSLGFGRIGQAIAKRALGFGMRILYHSHHRAAFELEEALNTEWVPLATSLQTSDFVTLHTLLTPETKHLINANTLGQMKSSAILINTAHGHIIDSAALYRALNTGQIAGAAINVTDPEPISMDSPLLTLDNLIITPHIGSASQQTRETMAKIAIASLIAGLKGAPLPHCVNPEVYH